jgi:hypothetical protein
MRFSWQGRAEMYKNAKGYWGTKQRGIPKQAENTIEETVSKLRRELRREEREHIEKKFPEMKSKRRSSLKSFAIKKKEKSIRKQKADGK